VQLSLDRKRDPASHYALARGLRPLRDRGILIVGSGNLVHNLRLAVFRDTAYDWALEFDRTIADLIEAGEHGPVVHYQTLGQTARLAVPTNEHYLPLLYALALRDPGEEVCFFAEGTTLGSVSMRSLVIG
jgi:4,5-DOPA dioxygenase extradiol